MIFKYYFNLFTTCNIEAKDVNKHMTHDKKLIDNLLFTNLEQAHKHMTKNALIYLMKKIQK